MGVSSQFRSEATLPTLDPLPQDPYIQAYFNHNQAAVYTDPYRNITRHGDDLEQVVVDAIATAQTSIDVAVHEFSLPEIAHALADRKAAGVEVRVVVENTYSTPVAQRNSAAFAQADEHSQDKINDLYAFIDVDQDGVLSEGELGNRDALTILAQANIPLIDDTADGSKGSGLMHHKFMVIDGRTVVTGSANWTLSCTHGDFSDPDSRGNANSILVIDSQPLAQRFQQEFGYLWGDGPTGRPDSLFGLQKPHRTSALVSPPGSVLEVQFSPTSKTQPWAQSVNGLIAKTLGQASQSVHLALFVFSEQAISNQLLPLANRGVPIKTLIDPGFAYRSYSEGLDMLGTTLPDHNCKRDNSVPWANPITTVGVPALPPSDKLHHKFAVLDQNIVLVGSQNWSQAANTTNDENLLVIRNATVAAHFEREFQRLYDGAELGMTPQLQGAIARQQEKCGL
ncbi:phospholipase D-like domain-containing protein [Leptolyngbya sp. CCNP1308]|uniref:phospholipase D-like domain-containing protein n=1 Tax=Leptolyngbya sp. CCNP1308 TaxID=3110255 RepID=UPI002B1F7C3B|nr:phospholipase D-like domain-containing protein [Leptolyngbya sp. CCNP1308]MEA5449881.1 phospholipase D-like domain-containing protein [Leptolyngbya sp. CCNP1308]